jgi:hypothetical protein
MDEAARFADQPIVFILILTGRTEKIAEYVRRCEITWPVVAIDPRDPSVHNQPGSLEDWMSWDGKEHYFSNLVRLKLPTGRLKIPGGSGLAPGYPIKDDLARLVEQTLKGATWHTDPKEVPASLKSAWRAIEFGLPAQAATAVRSGLKSKKADERAAAERLKATVTEIAEKRFKAAEAAFAEDRVWTAYSAWKSIQREMAEYGLPDAMSKRGIEWEADPGVKREINAAKSLESANKNLASSNPTLRKRGMRQLQQVMNDANAPEIAALAKSVMDRATAAGQ